MKAPGSDVIFFKRYWETIKGDLIEIIKEMSSDMARLDRLKYANVVLIPKKITVESVGDLRQISLLNSTLYYPRYLPIV